MPFCSCARVQPYWQRFIRMTAPWRRPPWQRLRAPWPPPPLLVVAALWPFRPSAVPPPAGTTSRRWRRAARSPSSRLPRGRPPLQTPPLQRQRRPPLQSPAPGAPPVQPSGTYSIDVAQMKAPAVIDAGASTHQPLAALFEAQRACVGSLCICLLCLGGARDHWGPPDICIPSRSLARLCSRCAAGFYGPRSSKAHAAAAEGHVRVISNPQHGVAAAGGAGTAGGRHHGCQCRCVQLLSARSKGRGRCVGAWFGRAIPAVEPSCPGLEPRPRPAEQLGRTQGPRRTRREVPWECSHHGPRATTA